MIKSKTLQAWRCRMDGHVFEKKYLKRKNKIASVCSKCGGEESVLKYYADKAATALRSWNEGWHKKFNARIAQESRLKRRGHGIYRVKGAA